MMINKTGYTFSFPLPFMLGHNMRGNRRGVLYVSRKDASLPFSKLNVDFLLYCAECQFINQLKIPINQSAENVFISYDLVSGPPFGQQFAPPSCVSIHSRRKEILAQKWVSPAPRPPLTSPMRTCWSPCLQVRGPPLSLWGIKNKINSINSINCKYLPCMHLLHTRHSLHR